MYFGINGDSHAVLRLVALLSHEVCACLNGVVAIVDPLYVQFQDNPSLLHYDQVVVQGVDPSIELAVFSASNATHRERIFMCQGTEKASSAL